MDAVKVTAQWVDGSEIWHKWGTPAAFSAFGDALDGGWRGTVSIREAGQPAGDILRAILVRETDATRITFAREATTVVISGSTAALRLLAANLKQLGQLLTPGGGPTHWDYFDGHPLVDEGSAPTAVWLT